MKTLSSITFLTWLSILVTSCNDTKNSYDLNWSKEIKEKIAKEANVPADSIYIDSSVHSVIKISKYKNGVLLKQVGIDPKTKDTSWIRLMSKDQKFSWGKEL